jgi:hypothetical protein
MCKPEPPRCRPVAVGSANSVNLVLMAVPPLHTAVPGRRWDYVIRLVIAGDWRVT